MVLYEEQKKNLDEGDFHCLWLSKLNEEIEKLSKQIKELEKAQKWIGSRIHRNMEVGAFFCALFCTTFVYKNPCKKEVFA